MSQDEYIGLKNTINNNEITLYTFMKYLDENNFI